MKMDFILPKKNEEIQLKCSLNKIMKKLGPPKDIKFVVGGSYAKGTWLPGNKDIDIFAKFNYNRYIDKNISNELKKVLLRKKIKFNIVHGSRDYFHVLGDNIIFEIIPVLDIKSSKKAMNVTDVSYLHVNYVKKNASFKLKKDIRILKKLSKANGLYGAESYIKGFSGYVLEVLIIYYGSLKKLMNSVKKWKSKEVIDPVKHYKSKKEVLLYLISSKKTSPLILIDPVQSDRNIAAALSEKKFNEFVNLSKVYDGSEFFFFKKEINISKLKGYFIFKISPLEGKKDIVGSKLLKALEKTKRSIESKGLKVYDYDWKWDDSAYFWFKTDKKLPKIKKHYGPMVKQKEHVEMFKKKWKKYKIQESKGRVFVNLKRDKIDVKEIISDILKRKDIKSNFKHQKVYK